MGGVVARGAKLMKLVLYLLCVTSMLIAQTSFGTGSGDYVFWPLGSAWWNTQASSQTVATLNASNLKASACGYISTPGGATKTLQNIHFLLGGAAKTGGTDLRVGIQAASASTGPPMQPDGAWASAGNAFVTVPDASMSPSSWVRSGTVGGTLSVSNGSIWCIVIEPENYAGSDSYVIRGTNQRSSSLLAVSASYNGTTWTGSAASMNHLLEFTDGTFGSIGLGVPFNVIGTALTYNSGSSPDEVALKIVPTVAMSATGICAENPYSTSTGNLEWVLYEGTTALVTVSSAASSLWSTAATGVACAMFSSAVTLNASSTYYAAIKPTTVNNVRLLYSTVSDATYWAAFPGGDQTGYSTRTDAGAWSDTTTRRPAIWLLIRGAGSTGGGGGGAYVVAQ